MNKGLDLTSSEVYWSVSESLVQALESMEMRIHSNEPAALETYLKSRPFKSTSHTVSHCIKNREDF